MSADAPAVDVWPGLRDEPGLADLPFPWPVDRAVRLGLHASTRRFYRLSPVSPGAEPATVVLVDHECDAVEAVDRYRRAATWLEAAGVRVPLVFGSTQRALLVEDGGDRLLSEEPDDGSLADVYDAAARVIDAIQLHGRDLPGPNPEWALDAERLRTELAFTEKHALFGWLDAGPRAPWAAAFDRLATAVGALPAAICHRDYHSRNLLVTDDGPMVLDFQDAMTGPRAYDLVSLLHDDYRDVPAGCRGTALRRWRLATGEIDAPMADAEIPERPASLPPALRQAYCLTLAQRALKALGTFGYQVHVAGRESYETFAPRTWRQARWALEQLGWSDLIACLAPFDRAFGSR